jgi:hypothetical protein
MIQHKHYLFIKKNLKNDKPQFISLLKNTIDIIKFIPFSFRHNFYVSTGRPRKYPLTAMILDMILDCILSIPKDTLLIIFLKYSKELRELCGFNKVPDAPKITRF